MKIRRKSRKYRAPRVEVTHMALERSICSNVQFQIEVNPLEDVNAGDGEGEYFDPIVS